ncbi:MAG: two-component system, cell cycle response regulator [Solirubrobacterales bacterium]|jgi:diguanylate cyclase (GGDEF)-like protein|nr:two-component system, cell cycle response regulator [Solirubrobacterales bacterium]
MEGKPTWLCPTQFDRERMLDMESKLQRARMILYGSLGVVFVVGIPWVGPWILLPLTASIVIYAGLKPFIARSARPEYPLAATVVTAQILIGVAIVLTGGPVSPAITILLLPIVTLPARFPTRGVVAGVLLTVVVLLASTVGADPAAFADDPTFTLVSLASIFGLAAFAHTLMSSEIEQRADATLDPLTGLLNRKALASRFAEIAEQASVARGWVSVIECDLDHFKRVNDEHGHGRGDAVLKDAAYTLRRNLRTFELVYRLGGEEFLIVLPGAGQAEATTAAERVRRGIEHARPGSLPVTASFGVASARGAEVQFEPLFRRADEALYEAKRAGRNRVVVSEPEAFDSLELDRPLPGLAPV